MCQAHEPDDIESEFDNDNIDCEFEVCESDNSNIVSLCNNDDESDRICDKTDDNSPPIDVSASIVVDSTDLESSDVVDKVNFNDDNDLVGSSDLPDIDLPLSDTNQGGMRSNDFSHSVNEPTTYRTEWVKSKKLDLIPTETTKTKSQRRIMSKEYMEAKRMAYDINVGNNLFQTRTGYNFIQQQYNNATKAMSMKGLNLEKVDGIRSLLGVTVRGIFNFAQMQAHKGFKMFGDEAIAAMLKELTQLDQGAFPGKPVVEPIDPDTLSVEEKKRALGAVNIIEQKRDGRIKARTCANGSKQRMYLKEDESVASPTVSLEGLLAATVIGAYERRKFISFDIPGAFLQAELGDDKMMLLKLRGEKMVELMCEVNEEHRKNVRIENGQTVLYMKVIRTLYGCIEAALNWYILFTQTLEKIGFTLNPYDKCIGNKIINGHQCTIAWHVDDCIVSHVEQKVLDDIAKLMIKEFGEMEISRGEDHSFLGMNFNIKDGYVEIEMKKQINNLITEFEMKTGERLDETVTSIANHDLFVVRPIGKGEK